MLRALSTAMLATIILPAALAASVVLSVPGDLAAPAQFGLTQLRAELEAKGMQIETAAKDAVLTIKIESGGSAAGLAVPDKPESFALKVSGKNVSVAGRDPVGLMYGILDLADQVRMADAGKALAGQLTTRAKAPYLEIRAVNQFIFTQALEKPDSWFFDESFWQEYFGMMAKTRHNLVDFHATFDLETTFFPNIYPYFVTVEGFTDVGATEAQARAGGVPAQTAKRNLAMFNRILKIAGDHGVHVAMMNYNAQTWRGSSARAIGGDELVAYIKPACKQFVAACPDLWMYGFRIGESGQPESFFTDAYVAALKEINTKMNLYTRSWLATKAKITPIAEGFSGAFYIEPKYNGEQLGLPYHAITNPRRWAPSYSYESYTDWPRNYKILFQVRANGTHRIFHWGWYDFVRRCAATGNLCDAAGFSVEPMTAYYPIENSYHEANETPRKYYKWATERDWMWYALWGRLMYDPTTSEKVFSSMYEERFGPESGRRLWKATQESGKILPMVYSYHCLGPDHRNMAPEMEIGNERRGGTTGMPAQTGDYDDFLTTNPLDGQVMASPVEYVEDVLAGTPDGRMTPLEVADYLDKAADESQQALLPLKVSGISRPGYRAGQLTEGAAYYSDRAYRTTGVPDRLRGAVLIATPNDDKAQRRLSWSFSVDHPVEVLIAVDTRNTKPDWMNSFQETDESITTSDSAARTYRLYRKMVPAGRVELGALPTSASFYFVVVVPEKGGTTAEKSADEYDKIRMDVDALGALGRYYAAKIRAAVHVAFYERTGDLEDLRQARYQDQRAVGQWNTLATVADHHYAPIREHLRMYTQWEGFTWTGEAKNLANQESQMWRMDRDAGLAAQGGAAPRLGHTPPAVVAAKQPVVLGFSLGRGGGRGGAAQAVLHYRTAELNAGAGQVPYTAVDMRREGSDFVAELNNLPDGARLQYYFTCDWRGRTTSLPEAGPAAPYARLVRGETDAPKLGKIAENADRAAGKAKISVAFTDESGVSQVTLYHKPIPSENAWTGTRMEQSGDTWTAETPLTVSGLLYYFEAVDIYGNAKVYPDFQVETPYRVIPSWQAK